MSSSFRIYDDRVTYPRSCGDSRILHHDVVEDALNHRTRNLSGGIGASISFNGSLTAAAGGNCNMHHNTSACPAGHWVFVEGGRAEGGLYRERSGHGEIRGYGGGDNHGGGQGRVEHTVLADIIRRNHRETDIVNRGVTVNAFWSEVHPKMMYNGSWPKEFGIPKTIDDLKSMDSSVLDRILMAYNLTEHSCERKYRPHGETKKHKLWRLLEFLGADHLIQSRGVEEEEIFYSRHERHTY